MVQMVILKWRKAVSVDILALAVWIKLNLNFVYKSNHSKSCSRKMKFYENLCQFSALDAEKICQINLLSLLRLRTS